MRRCAGACARRRFPSTATRSPSWASTRCWSRWPTSSPSVCASTAGSPTTTTTCCAATLPWVVAASLLVFTLFRLYEKWWRYVGQRDYVNDRPGRDRRDAVRPGVHRAHAPGDLRVRPTARSTLSVPTGVLGSFFLLTLVLVGGARFVARTVYERPLSGFRPRQDARRVLIVGAGDGGRLVLREILRNPELGLTRSASSTTTRPSAACAIDGVRVLGRTDELARILDEAEPDEVTIAIPSAPGTLRAARRLGLPRARHPGPHAADRLRAAADRRRQRRAPGAPGPGRGHPRPRAGADGARPRRRATSQGEVVLVTGAGGSIGSELCRQISRVAPRRLILLDHAEDNLFRIQRELEDDRHVHPSSLAVVLADCKEGERMREVFAEHRPTVVFHAAAYKHVGLMELNPVEAVRNNALATRLMARVAGEAGVGRFVLVSTDKAVDAGDGDGRVEGAGRVRGRGRRRSAGRTRATRPCASATCSARRARSCRSSAARSRSAAR